METRANHVLIGAFTLGVCIFAVLFALWMAKYTSEKAFAEYDVVFQEAVTGLSTGSQVLYSGISVGEVRGLSLMRDDPRKVVARIRLAADTPVKTDTRAKLTMTGLTGVAVQSIWEVALVMPANAALAGMLAGLLLYHRDVSGIRSEHMPPTPPLLPPTPPVRMAR